MSAPLLVTGGSGFIGRRLLACLAHENQNVIAVTRAPLTCVSPHVTMVHIADWREEALQRQLGKVEFSGIINLAASGVDPQDRNAEQLYLINTALPVALVRIAAERGAVMVNAGSCAEYAADKQTEHICENTPLEIIAPYGASKAEGGRQARDAATALGVPFRHLRVFNTYGPGEAAYRLLPSLLRARADNRIAFSQGCQVRDFVHVDDVVDAFIHAVRALREGRANGTAALNVCTGVATSVRDYATLAARLLGIEASKLGFGDLALRADEKMSVVGNPDAMQIDLGWRAAYDVERGLKATLGQEGVSR